MKIRPAILHWTLAIAAVAGVTLAGCVREQPATPTRTPAERGAVPKPPTVERDIAGKPRARPRPTMGAIEAEPDTTPVSPKKRPESSSKPAKPSRAQ